MKVALVIVAIVFGGIFWKIHHDNKKFAEKITAVAQAKEDRLREYVEKIKRQRDANAVKELNGDKPLGEAGTAVREFFRCWKDGQYDKMRDMLSAPSANTNDFADRLRKATLNWRHMEVLSEKQGDDGWKVAFRVEVTSPESALAAVAIDEAASYKNLKGEYAGVSMMPLILGIEKFTRYDIEWSVVKTDGKMHIDAYPGKDGKGVNLISYVMNDTITLMRRMGMFQGLGKMPDLQEQVRSVMAFWMTIAGLVLKLDDKASTQVIQAAGPLIGQGSNNLNLISEGVLAIIQQGRTPQIPQ